MEVVLSLFEYLLILNLGVVYLYWTHKGLYYLQQYISFQMHELLFLVQQYCIENIDIAEQNSVRCTRVLFQRPLCYSCARGLYVQAHIVAALLHHQQHNRPLLCQQFIADKSCALLYLQQSCVSKILKVHISLCSVLLPLDICYLRD